MELVVDGGGLVIKEGSLGTGEACCCDKGVCNCNCDCEATVTVNEFSVSDSELPCPDPLPFPECDKPLLQCRRLCVSEATDDYWTSEGYSLVVSSGYYFLSCTNAGKFQIFIQICSEYVTEENCGYTGGPCSFWEFEWATCSPNGCPYGSPSLLSFAPATGDWPNEILLNDCMTLAPVISIECNPLP